MELKDNTKANSLALLNYTKQSLRFVITESVTIPCDVAIHVFCKHIRGPESRAGDLS